MTKPFQVGVTGGIGAGKSVLTRIFSVMGIPVYDSDSRAKQLMNEDNKLREDIIAEFGRESYKDSRLNRPYLAANVFNNPEKLKKLNGLVHPRVGEDYRDWLSHQEGKIVIKEAALIFEAGIADKLDYVIVVTAPDALRVERVAKRDGRTHEQIREIISNQLPQEKTSKMANALIVNDGSQSMILQALEVLKDIKRKASLS